MKNFLFSFSRILIGALFLDMAAQFSITLYFTPVPITLQSLAVSILAMTLGAKEAPLAVLLYLLQAKLGFPVLQGGKANPDWIHSPIAGYLIGFLFSSCLVANLLTYVRPRSFVKSWLILSCNEGTILLIGATWLSHSLGVENGIYKGLLPFLPGAFVKITTASSIYYFLNQLRGVPKKVFNVTTILRYWKYLFIPR